MFHFLRANPGVAISFVLLSAGAFVFTSIGLLIARSGGSLRPIYWLAGFFSLVVAPQVVLHLFTALRSAPLDHPLTVATNPVVQAPAKSGLYARTDLRSLFGTDADPQQIVDVRNLPGGAFSTADSAQFAILPEGETLLIGHFETSGAALKAWNDYYHTSGLDRLKGTGDAHRGFLATRAAGDRAYAVQIENLVVVWTGPNDAAIKRRMASGGFALPTQSPLNSSATSSEEGASGSNHLASKSPLQLCLIAVGLSVYVFAVVLYFFKGAAWAGTYRPRTLSPQASLSEIATRLKSINALDVPFRIEQGTEPNEFFATWRYAEAKWIDLARARGLKRMFRIRLFLDERTGTVRTTDYVTHFNGSVGRGGLDVEWHSSLGIVFFQSEHARVLGLQLDEQGRFKPELSYSYTFNLNEMKSPLLEVVTRAGWTWRPTVWRGPIWLRWLTE